MRPSLKSSQPLFSSATSTWAMLLGILLLMLGNGLQASLLGLRASQQGFGSSVTGVVMACFFAGFLLGSIWTPHAVYRVGYVRAFAALAASASISILVHAVFLTPLIWGIMRFVTGLCYSGIFVIAESWLNETVSNENRGQMIAFYMAVSFLGMGGGQLLLKAADPGKTDLFILASILISVSVVPSLLSASPVPLPHQSDGVGVGKLFRICPLGICGIFCAGVINGTLLGMGAVFAHNAGLSVAQLAAFMLALIAGAALMQYPIGKLSDIFDRRKVLTITIFIASITAVFMNVAMAWPDPWMLLAVGVFGGLCLSIHPLSIAFTNDYIASDEVLGASSDMVLVLGAGSVAGPLFIGQLMKWFGPPVFFWWQALVLFCLGLFAIWRILNVPSIPLEDQGEYIATPVQTSFVELDKEYDKSTEILFP